MLLARLLANYFYDSASHLSDVTRGVTTLNHRTTEPCALKTTRSRSEATEPERQRSIEEHLKLKAKASIVVIVAHTRGQRSTGENNQRAD